jgi:hypothetical protein
MLRTIYIHSENVAPNYTGILSRSLSLSLRLDEDEDSPAIFSTIGDTTGKFRKSPITGRVLMAVTAIGMKGPNRFKNPIACSRHLLVSD